MMFNLKCCVKGMLFYLATFESQGCVGSLCPWSLTSRLRSDLDLNQGNLKLCLIIGGFFQCLSVWVSCFLVLWTYIQTARTGEKNVFCYHVLLYSCVWKVFVPIFNCPFHFLGKSKRFCSSHSKGKEELLKYSMVFLFVKGRIHFATKTAGGSIILV